MTYDLRREPWLPWRRASGQEEWGPPALLVDGIADDPIVALAAPRPDFQGALQEFLIGLLTVALQPADEDAWLELWHAPPSREALQAALDALPAAFDLDGDGPRFLQDLAVEDMASGAVWTAESLLIDTPGTKAQRVSRQDVITDLFVKPARVRRLGRPAAAMALLTLQTYAPEGGRGHLTSMRGGGPLTTLVDPRRDAHDEAGSEEQPLWARLWANAETREQWSRRRSTSRASGPADIFPWLAATRSGDRVVTTPEDAHPLQAYFGMPRRIRLHFAEGGTCDVTGREDERTVTEFVMRTYGVKYVGWRHPLSPYYRVKSSQEWLPVHGKSGGVAWRDWLSLTLGEPEAGLREPAAVVAAFGDRGVATGSATPRLHAFGYDMDSMKACGWVDASLPILLAVGEGHRRVLRDAASRFTEGAGIAASALLGAVKDALFQRAEDAPGDLSQVKEELWASTEQAFYDAMRAIAGGAGTIESADDACRAFAGVLERAATAIFDRWCPSDGIGSEALRRLVFARYGLVMTLRGYSKLGDKLFDALRIPHPEQKKAGRNRKRSRKEAAT